MGKEQEPHISFFSTLQSTNKYPIASPTNGAGAGVDSSNRNVFISLLVVHSTSSPEAITVNDSSTVTLIVHVEGSQ